MMSFQNWSISVSGKGQFNTPDLRNNLIYETPNATKSLLTLKKNQDNSDNSQLFYIYAYVKIQLIANTRLAGFLT